MHCRLLTQYAIIMVQFLAGLRKIKLRAACCFTGTYSNTAKLSQEFDGSESAS